MAEKHLENYIATLHDLNLIEYELLSKSRKETEDMVEDILILGYLQGVKASEENLGFEVESDIVPLLDRSLEKSIAGKTFRERIEEYCETEDYSAIARVVETEYHRLFNTGMLDTAVLIGEEEGLNITKTWITTGDDKVRDTHDYLEGMSVGLNDKFYTFDGDSADSPGGFTNASNNVNCRCVLKFNY